MIEEIKFGQREPLTTRLRGLVRAYPKNVGILQEFIQNADDAQATSIRFVLDLQPPRRQMPADLNGPALLVENDRVFTETGSGKHKKTR